MAKKGFIAVADFGHEEITSLPEVFDTKEDAFKWAEERTVDGEEPEVYVIDARNISKFVATTTTTLKEQDF